MTNPSLLPLQKPVEERIIEAACIYWGIDRSYFFTKYGRSELTHRKAVVYYLIRQHTTISLAAMAAKFGCKSHQAVGRLIENIEATQRVLKHHSEDIKQVNALAQRLTAVLVPVELRTVD